MKHCSLIQLPGCCAWHIRHSTSCSQWSCDHTCRIPCWTFSTFLVRPSGGCCKSFVLHFWHPSSAGCVQAILENRPGLSLLVALTVIQTKHDCRQFSVTFGSLRFISYPLSNSVLLLRRTPDLILQNFSWSLIQGNQAPPL